MDSEKDADPLTTFRRYSAAFQRLDPEGTAAFYDEPALLLSPRGVLATQDRGEVEAFYRQVMSELPGLGYKDTELSQLREERLGQDLALVSGVGTWTRANGERISRFGMTYTLRWPGRADPFMQSNQPGPSSPSWRILVALIYDLVLF